MLIEIKRYIFNGSNTIGRLFVDGVFFCFTLEDKVRPLNKPSDKIKNETAIPYGSYKAIVSFSPRFKKELPELLDVPYFEKIRIHGGNTEKDSDGCILIGANTDEKRIWNCAERVKTLTSLIKEAGGCTVTVLSDIKAV